MIYGTYDHKIDSPSPPTDYKHSQIIVDSPSAIRGIIFAIPASLITWALIILIVILLK